LIFGISKENRFIYDNFKSSIMNALKKISISLALLFFCLNSIAQNHRQAVNWLSGNFKIESVVDSNKHIIGTSSFINLSPLDSSQYWVVEEFKSQNNIQKRIIKITLVDSGLVSLDFYKLPNNQMEIKSLEILRRVSSRLEKINTNSIIIEYNRPGRNFQLVRSAASQFVLDKFSLKLKCCNDFSTFYFKNENAKAVFYFQKIAD
jgi:hypothetical protein